MPGSCVFLRYYLLSVGRGWRGLGHVLGWGGRPAVGAYLWAGWRSPSLMAQPFHDLSHRGWGFQLSTSAKPHFRGEWTTWCPGSWYEVRNSVVCMRYVTMQTLISVLQHPLRATQRRYDRRGATQAISLCNNVGSGRLIIHLRPTSLQR